MTSGAVQPPGSKGDDVVHTRTHSQDSGDESDATTTFTEEDDMDEVVDDLEDEEERLIMNGGVGIPIGPVSEPFPPHLCPSSSNPRMASRAPCYLPWPLNTLAVSVSSLISTKRCSTVASRYVSFLHCSQQTHTSHSLSNTRTTSSR